MWLSRMLYIGALVLLGSYYPKYGRYAFYDWFGFAALFSTVLVYMVRGRMPSMNRYLLLAAALLSIGVVVTTLGLSDPVPSVLSGFLLIYVLVLWMSLPQFLMTNWWHLRTVYAALGISAVVTSAFAVGQVFLGFPHFTEMQLWGRETGLTRHPNELGTFCAMAFPYLLCLANTKERSERTRRYIWMGAALFPVLGVLLSGSMTGAVALAVGAVVYLVLTNRRGRFRAVVLVVAALVLGGYLVANFSNYQTQFLGQRIESFLTSNAGKYTMEQRVLANQTALSDIEKSPLQGLGFQSQVSTMGGNITVHNTLLLAWHDGGLFTLMGILAVLFGAAMALMRSWRYLRQTGLSMYRPYIAAAVAAFGGSLVCIQTSPILYQRSSWFPVAMAYVVGVLMRESVMNRYEVLQKDGARDKRSTVRSAGGNMLRVTAKNQAYRQTS